MTYHLHRNVNGKKYSLGTFNTLTEAVAYAPRSGEPKKTGSDEWAFLPDISSELIVISRDKEEKL